MKALSQVSFKTSDTPTCFAPYLISLATITQGPLFTNTRGIVIRLYLCDTFQITIVCTIPPIYFVENLFLLLFILPRICSQDISRTDKAIVMQLAMMIDPSLT